MRLEFTKMHGCGNDYVYVNGATQHVAQADKPDLVRRLSDRHFGVGGDGVIFINPSDEADFEMEMYNADGSRGEMCGNGIRCVGKYVYDKGLTNERRITVVSCGKVKYLTLTAEGAGRGEVTRVQVNMGPAVLEAADVPVLPSERSAAEAKAVNAVANAGVVRAVLDDSVSVRGKTYRITAVSMGNPHAVTFVDDVDALDLPAIGPAFERHMRFPNRTNTEFVQVLDRATVRMRVWERGTGETLCCGTGCCATAVAGILNGLLDDAVTVRVRGGEVDVAWDRSTNTVWMTGPAETVFEGSVIV